MRRMPITRHYWLVFVLVASGIGAVQCSGWTEQSFRLTGMSLQLLGVLTVVWGIMKTRAEFGQIALQMQFSKWWKSFPPLHPPTMTVNIKGKLSEMRGHIVLRGIQGPAEDQSIEGRLAHLEKLAWKLENDLAKANTAIRDVQDQAKRAMDARDVQIADHLKTVDQKIAATAVGGTHVSAVGVILLFVGTVFGGMSAELSLWALR